VRHQVAGHFGAVLAVRLNVSLPGLERQAAQDLVDARHQACQYSNDTPSNIDVAINLLKNRTCDGTFLKSQRIFDVRRNQA
jgi:hypothetical protein